MGDLKSAGDAAAVEAAARSLYGQAPGPAAGVLHVVATWRDPAGGLSVMKIRPETPKSDWDFFALNLARARAGAIVVTGRILREEPELRYALQGPGALPAGLADWRRRAGLDAPPLLVVLTSGRGLDFAHPAFHGWARPVVFTSQAAAERLSPPAGVRVVGDPAPSLRAAIGWLRRQGVDGISVEAGPSTAVDLYRDPVAVDELMLSVFEGPLDPALRGGDFPTPERLSALLPVTGGASVRREASGIWRFARMRR